MGLFGDSNERERKNEIRARNEEIAALEVLISEDRALRQRLIGIENFRAAPKWEYLIVEDVSEDQLDQYGHKGWELVSLATYTVGFGLGGNTSMKVHMRYAFKRPMLDKYSNEVIEVEERLEAIRAQQADLQERIASLQII